MRVHNELRAKVANGQEKRGKPGPQPPAADMEQMVSDFSVHTRVKIHTYSKIHILKIPIFTKLTFLKSQFSQNSHF